MQSTRRGSFPVHRSEKTPGSKYSSTSGLSPRGHLERQAEFHASTQEEGWLSDRTKGQFSRASFGKNPRFQIQLDKRPLSPGTSREASGVPCLNPRRGLTLLSPVCRD